MALPHRRQPFARFIRSRFDSYAEAADAFDLTVNEIINLTKGARYPRPREIAAITAAFDGMPIEVMFDASMLKYRDVDPWPPVGSGFRTPRSF